MLAAGASGTAALSNGNSLRKMLSEDNVVGKIKNSLGNAAGKVKSGAKALWNDNRGTVDLDAFGRGSKSNRESKNLIKGKVKNKLLRDKIEIIGPNFVPNGKNIQEGVNLNSLIPTKNLDIKRMKNAIKYGGDKPIIVDNDGNVLDGHHRLKYAIINNKAVDVSIGY